MPEHFLPAFMDLVIWGHEHECKIDPTYNPDMDFHVMQPGSSVATSLMPGEAVTKYVSILSVTGREFKTENIRLKTVRPFVMDEIVLQNDPEMKKVAKNDNNRTQITKFLIKKIEGMIARANSEWLEAQADDDAEPPLPLIRLRVEYTAPEGGRFDCENPQRFSNRFVGKVANVNDVVQFHRKKVNTGRKAAAQPTMPEESIMSQLSIETVKVERLVKEFLTAQSLTILPQNSFGDAVSQFVDKDDKHAMEMFVSESLKNQVSHLVGANDVDEDKISKAMEQYKARLEDLFDKGQHKRLRRGTLKPRPEGYDSELDGAWEDNMHAYELDESAIRADPDSDAASVASRPARGAAARGRGGRSTGRARQTRHDDEDEDDDDDDDDDVVMIDDHDNDDDESQLFVSNANTRKSKAAPKRAPVKKAPSKKAPTKAPVKAPARATRATKQSTLPFSQPAASQPRSRQPIEVSGLGAN